MSLPTKNTAMTEKILLAATQLFSHQGYNGTSTREIARLAEVSENTLFRHFEHKEDLFWAALRAHSVSLVLCKQSIEEFTASDAPEVVLPRILELLTNIANFKPELTRLMAVAFLELQWKAEGFCQEAFTPVCALIRKYLSGSIEAGRVRDFDPTLVTTAIITMALMHPSMSRLIGGETSSFSSGRDAARGYSKFWLDVLTTKPNGSTVAVGAMSGPHLV